jgi:DNA-binding PadR family transcriptional regulator
MIVIPTFRYNVDEMKSYHLGEFEEIVILTIGILNNEAYSVSIKDEIESRLPRTVSMGALHTALRRLEDKGYLRSYAGEPTQERAGRPKRYFEITAMGKKAMQYAKATRDGLWGAIPMRVWQSNLEGI